MSYGRKYRGKFDRYHAAVGTIRNLYNATRVREMIGAGPFAKLLLRVAGFPDIVRVSGSELLEELDQCYSSFGMDETMVICRSNKRANRFNEGIRARILYREDAFSSGDKVMIVKNNYFWGAEYDKDDFIANGDYCHCGEGREI